MRWLGGMSGMLVLGGFVLAPSSGVPEAEQDLVKSMVTGAKEVEKTVRKISEASKKKIEDATGLSLSQADLSAPVYRIQAALDQRPFSKEAEVFAVVTTVPGPKGEIKLGVGVHQYKRGRSTYRIITHIKIFNHKEDKQIEKPQFLRQFLGVSYGSGIEQPISELKQAIEKSKSQPNSIKGALGLNWAMHQVDNLWDAMQYKSASRDKSASDDADQLVQALDMAEKSVAKMSISEADKQYMRSTFSKFKNEAKTAADSFKAGQFDRVRTFLTSGGAGYCGGCHGPMERKIQQQRRGMGLMDEYFMVDYDATVPSQTNLEAYQAVATGIKKAALMALLSE